MDPGEPKDYGPREFMEQDVMVKREDGDQADLSHDGDGVPQYEHEHHHGVEVQANPASSCCHHPYVWIRAINVFEGEENENSDDDESDVTHHEEHQEPDQGQIGDQVILQVQSRALDL